jgi:Ser/Thr protein kinase RdoA (MazF antagonist)
VIAAHLSDRYRIEVREVTELDLGVYRIDRRDGPPWVARVFPDGWPVEAVEGDATILRNLERAGFPAERCAGAEPVSMRDGRPVLVTGFVDGPRPEGGSRTFGVLGHLLGLLHTHPADRSRPGGAWHHLATGTPAEEIAAAVGLLESGRDRLPDDQYRAVRLELRALDDGTDLPHAFVHPDPVPSNALAPEDSTLTLVDWTNAGRGPRLWSLAPLLYAAGARDPRLVDVAASRYARHVRLERDELDRLDGVLRARPLLLDLWAWAHGRREFVDLLDALTPTRRLAERIANRARTALR